MKGLSIQQRDEKIAKLLRFSYFLEHDYARYDMSISKPYLEQVEYVNFCMPFQGDEHWMYRLAFRMAFDTFGVSEIGLSYQIEGSRCSGDAHTSCGNGTDNDFNTWVALEPLPDDAWDSVEEGDDGLGGVDGKYKDQAIFNMHILCCLGFQLKLDVYNSFDQVSFCGRFLTYSRDKVLSMCDLKRTLAKIHTTCSDGDPQALALAKMISYYHTDAGTPIIGPLVYTLIQILLPLVNRRRLARAVMHLTRSLWERDKLCRVDFYTLDYPFVDIKPELRALVALRTGYSPGMQQAFESYYMSFMLLGHVPAVVDRIPEGWNFDNTSHVHGPVYDYLA